MLVSERLNILINAEIGREFAAHLQYLAVATYFEGRSLDKLAAFFYNQAEEEKVHGVMLVKYISEADGRVEIPAAPAPRHDFADAIEAMQLFYDQEEAVTQYFYEMVAAANEENDFATHSFLQWFINEQREEMSTASRLLDMVRMAGDNLLMVEMLIDNVSAAADAAAPPGG